MVCPAHPLCITAPAPQRHRRRSSEEKLPNPERLNLDRQRLSSCPVLEVCPPPPPPEGCIRREGEGSQRRPQQRLGGQLEEVAKAVGGGYCRLQMLLRPALAVRGTVAGHRPGALKKGVPPPPPFPMHRCPPPSTAPAPSSRCAPPPLVHSPCPVLQSHSLRIATCGRCTTPPPMGPKAHSLGPHVTPTPTGARRPGSVCVGRRCLRPSCCCPEGLW